MNMSAGQATRSQTPWYKEHWTWLLMLMPATAVVAGFVTLWLAITSFDGLVADDYYKQGLAINTDQGRSVRASALGLHARLQLESGQNRIGLDLASDVAGTALPPVMTLRLLHATRNGVDVTLTLARVADGRYEAALPELVPGRWNLKAEADNWRLDGSLNVPHETAITLLPLVQLAPAEH